MPHTAGEMWAQFEGEYLGIGRYRLDSYEMRTTSESAEITAQVRLPQTSYPTTEARAAILLMAYGGPDTLEDVRPYLLDVGRPPSGECIPAALDSDLGAAPSCGWLER